METCKAYSACHVGFFKQMLLNLGKLIIRAKSSSISDMDACKRLRGFSVYGGVVVIALFMTVQRERVRHQYEKGWLGKKSWVLDGSRDLVILLAP